MGKNWKDPVVITESSKVFAAFSLVLTGVAVWDVLSTIWFEWQIITGRRKFRWPMIIYFVARIAMLMHIFAITINRNALHEVPCTELTFMSKFCDALGTCLSSLILVLRTRAVWHRDKKVTAILGVLFIGQIVIWSQTFRFSKAKWNATRGLCDVLSTAPRALMISVWAYTMAFDLVILLLCSYKLASHQSSTLGNLLLRDGIGYFCAAFAANLVQTVMAGLQLNPVMNIITLSFAVVVSVIAATTVFRNVFTAYDNFANDNIVAANTNGSDGPHLRTGPRILFNHNISTQMHQLSTNEIPLGEYKTQSSECGELSVRKVVDVEVGGESIKEVNPMLSTEKSPVPF
ncbi:hypothetical protein HYPSUDRAFT_1029023 [Hypholoma sublateritium FD-334 SS-4]|uniref:Transmembrane protein n=1 Tax=Hypholoma sublateritium (strain FD-334 SS-4) TaxID=945553 RepID=A0A0D2Q5C8_HYPSF|nr:hypothetical protein HYPSUDRAFT_1029023 [Hypholoma sublateritium FD-334 SS-4]